MQRTQGADLLLCGIDLNGRLPGEFGTATGPVVCGEPDATGKRFAQILVRMRMWATATFRHLHPGEDCTYVHPTGSEHRIDFIVAGGTAACLQAQSQVHIDFDTGAPREDHRLVGLWVGGLFKEVRQRASNTIERRSCLMKGERSLLRHVPDSSSPRGRRRQTSII